METSPLNPMVFHPRFPHIVEKILDFLVEEIPVCIHCPKGSMFTHQSKHSMKMHMKTKHRNVFMQDKLTDKKEVPTCFKCKFQKCNYSAREKEEVISHIKSHHND